MCFNYKCSRCKKMFKKKELYYHKGWDKYYKTYWCNNCLQKHYSGN